ncbi:hypothetical protein KQX54_017370 [Cotesia glomerata]|uniref:Uncharacterized protein n=1 Tax=Cotesia glomerata TaxID=32391 RepID=A0AAV7I339_COTGL|nr:hypothetical protein KQX54_017370 [Cotesia glomerata]
MALNRLLDDHSKIAVERINVSVYQCIAVTVARVKAYRVRKQNVSPRNNCRGVSRLDDSFLHNVKHDNGGRTYTRLHTAYTTTDIRRRSQTLQLKFFGKNHRDGLHRYGVKEQVRMTRPKGGKTNRKAMQVKGSEAS